MQSSTRLTFGRDSRSRRGAILVLSAMLIIVMIAMLAFSIDFGYMMHVRTEMQRAVDAGAMAGASIMVDGTKAAAAEAKSYVRLNTTGNRTVKNKDIDVEFGQWDSITRKFTEDDDDVPEAIRVRASNSGLPLFFGRALGVKSFDSTAEAVAIYLPRDIVLALDYSGSMCFDSQVRAFDVIGQSAVEDNMQGMYQELGSPKYGKLKWKGTTINSSDVNFVLADLKLTTEPYPYPGGSWADYVSYVMNDGEINAAGLRNSYSYLTWINYLQVRQQSYADTPALWKTSEQPITAVKDAVDLFLAYLQENSTQDRVGFSLYTSSNSTAILETPLTKDFNKVSNLVRTRQAGHYVGGTNIYDGMKTARLELEKNSRVGAKKMMVLMTDGEANLPWGAGKSARDMALDEAALAAKSKIAIVAICLGSGADTALLDEIAQITGGASFVVPGGQSIDEVEQQLRDVFSEVASTRPFKLVK